MQSEKLPFTGEKYKIILIGDSDVGKTSIFWRYTHGEALSHQPITTIDFGYKTIAVQDKNIKLCIWDTAGQ